MDNNYIYANVYVSFIIWRSIKRSNRKNEYNNEKIVLKVKGNSLIVESVDLKIKMY